MSFFSSWGRGTAGRGGFGASWVPVERNRVIGVFLGSRTPFWLGLKDDRKEAEGGWGCDGHISYMSTLSGLHTAGWGRGGLLFIETSSLADNSKSHRPSVFSNWVHKLGILCLTILSQEKVPNGL